MTETATEATAIPDAIGFGFAEIATLASLRGGEAAVLSAEALRVGGSGRYRHGERRRLLPGGSRAG